MLYVIDQEIYIKTYQWLKIARLTTDPIVWQHNEYVSKEKKKGSLKIEQGHHNSQGA